MKIHLLLKIEEVKKVSSKILSVSTILQYSDSHVTIAHDCRKIRQILVKIKLVHDGFFVSLEQVASLKGVTSL